MKEFFIFNIKKEFATLYKEKPSELFFIFNRIYAMKEMDKEYGYNLFSQISLFFDKQQINHYLNRKYKDKIMYSTTKNEHILNNLFLNEISILKVKNSSLRIETNQEYPAFFKDLKGLPGELFVCNFKEQEFFFLRNKKEVVKEA